MPSQTISDMVRRGDLRPLARGIYTIDTTSSPEAIVARHWHTIVGHELPGTVITDRSALTGGKVDGYLYLSRDGRPRELALPGLDVLTRRGAGPLDGDLQLPDGLWQASRARALAENMRPSRSRGGRPRRTLDDHEIDAWIERLCRLEGEERLTEYGDRPSALDRGSASRSTALLRSDATSALRSAASRSRRRTVHSPHAS